jgi:hypothetical protein
MDKVLFERCAKRLYLAPERFFPGFRFPFASPCARDFVTNDTSGIPTADISYLGLIIAIVFVAR